MAGIPRYTPNTRKAVEVILWIVNRDPAFDIYHVVKAAYFADKYHVQNYGRPIAGDTYAAEAYGPLPRVVYGLLRRDPIELIALETNGVLPFEIGERFHVNASREPNMRLLSESDVEALEHGCAHVRDKSFGDIFDETHSDPAYTDASGGQMDYRDFIPDDDPDKADKAEVIEETARYAVI